MPNFTQEEWDALIEQATTLGEHCLYMQSDLRSMRENQGWTQAQVAARLGTNIFAVQNIENGDPTLSELRQYALAVGAEIKYEVKVYQNDSITNPKPGLGNSVR